MTPDHASTKLEALRAKTDRQVSDFIRMQLNAAAQLAFEADQARRTKNIARAKRCERRAASAILLAQKLKVIVSARDLAGCARS